MERCLPLRAEYARTLAALARDKARDPEVRDYALQHLRTLWDATPPGGLRDSITATFAQVAAADPALAPSALLSLHVLGGRAGGRGDAVPSSRIEPLALSMLADPLPPGMPSPGARMTAARVAGERRLASCRPALLRLVSSTSEHMLARMAAVSALSRIGDPSDLPALKAVKPDDVRLAAALRHAIDAFPTRR